MENSIQEEEVIRLSSGDVDKRLAHLDHNKGTRNASDLSGNDCVTELEKMLLTGDIKTEEDAYKLYCHYAHTKGFSVRRGKQYYFTGTKRVRTKEYFCSKEGAKDEKAAVEGAALHRIDTRSGCKAMVRFTCNEEGRWKVSKFVSEHNHEMVKPHEMHRLRSARSVSYASGGLLGTMVNTDFHATGAFSYMPTESRVIENVDFPEKDCYNKAGDLQSLVNYFRKKDNEDYMFYWNTRLDEEGRLTDLFWRDGRSRIDYDSFGDVVVFDTTYRTNRYNVICAPFVGVNHHWQNVMFGCALLSNEETTNFMWLFKTFLESMGNRSPKTMITDQSQAIADAIEVILPNTRHLLCLRHISKNASSHLGTLNSNKDFMELFDRCLLKCETEKEFKDTWSHMISHYGAQENEWLRDMYDIRHKWCMALNNDTFHAGIKSTERSESTDHVLHGIRDKTASFTTFAIAFEKLLQRWRTKEGEKDYVSGQACPPCAVKESKMLQHASKVYTHEIYKLFETEFLKGVCATSCRETSCMGTLYEFELSIAGSENSRPSKVSFDTSTMELNCTCKKFEAMGILCSHILKVLSFKDVTKIPDKCILSRWRKDMKERLYRGVQDDLFNGNFTNHTMRYVYNLVQMCQDDDGAKAILSEGLHSMASRVQEHFKKSSLGAQSATKKAQVVDGGQSNDNETLVLDPHPLRPIGVSNEKLESHFEKRKKRNASERSGKSKQRVGTPLLLPKVNPLFHCANSSYHVPFPHNIFMPFPSSPLVQYNQQLREGVFYTTLPGVQGKKSLEEPSPHARTQ